VPADFVREVSEGLIDYSMPIEVNRTLMEGNHDLILSVGQVVPHEVVGMANYNKNIFVGLGGSECINKSHFLGAASGWNGSWGK
jgi:nickel-dependent lactate racemase